GLRGRVGCVRRSLFVAAGGGRTGARSGPAKTGAATTGRRLSRPKAYPLDGFGAGPAVPLRRGGILACPPVTFSPPRDTGGEDLGAAGKARGGGGTIPTRARPLFCPARAAVVA